MGCTRCGACCALVILDHTQKEAHLPRNRYDEREIRWVEEELVPITLREAQKVNPRIDGGYQNGEKYFRCSNLDPGTNLCTVHDQRPLTCQMFPFTPGEKKEDHVLMGPSCGYHADVRPSQRAGCAKMNEIFRKLKEDRAGTLVLYPTGVKEGDRIPCQRCGRPYDYKVGVSLCAPCLKKRSKYLAGLPRLTA